MTFRILFLCMFVTSCFGDWVSDWMSPLQNEFREESYRRSNNEDFKPFLEAQKDEIKNSSPKSQIMNKKSDALSTAGLKLKLEETLQNAKELSEALRVQILELTKREALLKDAITKGRYGVSTLTVSTLSQVPRSYIIRDGHWILCNGMIQFPVPGQGAKTNLFNELFNEPRCIGREVPTVQDPCVFNSVIKYEVVPTRRALEYLEEDYLCLKPAFNNTLERYMSVTKETVNDTCKEEAARALCSAGSVMPTPGLFAAFGTGVSYMMPGWDKHLCNPQSVCTEISGVIRSLAENTIECGVRVMSEYSFYPSRSSAAASLPLEYCVENDGSCKLITAWHISNNTIENFEFLKSEQSFKQYFIKTGSYDENIM